MSTPQEPGSGSPTAAVTVVLSRHQAAFLDEISAAIRRNTGKAINRSALLRAMAGAVMFCYEDWLHCHSEAELKQLILRRLRLNEGQPSQSSATPASAR